MTKRRSHQDLVREFETIDLGDKLALMPVVCFTVSNKMRGIAPAIPPKSGALKRKRSKRA